MSQEKRTGVSEGRAGGNRECDTAAYWCNCHVKNMVREQTPMRVLIVHIRALLGKCPDLNRGKKREEEDHNPLWEEKDLVLGSPSKGLW